MEQVELENQKFHKEFDNRLVKFHEVVPMLIDSDYIWVGHGTGRSNDSEETINSIFENGLRTKDNSLFFASFVLSAPSEFLINEYKKMDASPPTIDTLKKQLNNWPHANSKKIVLIRVPRKYINWRGEKSDLEGEMYGAIMNEVKLDNGDIKLYVDPRFIFGYYDANIKIFRINERFEKEYTEETMSKLRKGYIKALRDSKNRLRRLKRKLVPKVEVTTETSEPNFDVVDYDEPIEWADSSSKGAL